MKYLIYLIVLSNLFYLTTIECIDITRCIKCRFLLKNQKNIYQSHCKYHSIYNSTYPEFIFEPNFEFKENNFISIQEAVNDETKCGQKRKHYKEYPF